MKKTCRCGADEKRHILEQVGDRFVRTVCRDKCGCVRFTPTEEAVTA